MEKDTNIILRINSDLKERSVQLAKRYGVSLSQLISACLVEFDRRDFVPLNIRHNFPKKYYYENVLTIAQIKSNLEKTIMKDAPDKIKKVYLFGSYARGEQTPKSDIDLRFEIDEGFSLFDHSNIRLDLIDAFHKNVDIVTAEMKDLDEFFASNIRKDEICIYERQTNL